MGPGRADAAVAAVVDVVDAELPDVDLVRDAAAWKAGGGLAHADAFALATAVRHGAELLTGDPEIVALGDPRLQVVDLRAH